MARRGRGKDDRYPKIHPLAPTHPVRKKSAVSRFGSAMRRPRQMAAWLDRYAREQDRLAEHEPVMTAVPEPRYARAKKSPRTQPEPAWMRFTRWLRRFWNGG